jgi:DNA-binding CsgD family transcriptional regulator
LSLIPSLDFLRFTKAEGILDFDLFLRENAAVYGESCEWQRLSYINDLAQGRLERVEELRRAIVAIEPRRRLDLICGNTTLALFEEASGNRAKAQAALALAIGHAKGERITQSFVNDYQLLLPIFERIASSGEVDDFTQHLLLHLRQLGTGESLRAKETGLSRLTDRENDIVYLLVSGLKAPDIALRLSISKETVRRHIANIYRKLDVHSRTQLLLHFQQASA